MTTPNTDLTERRIAGVLRGHAFVQHQRGVGEHIDLSPQAADHFAARIWPIVVAAVKRGQAEAWEKAIYHAEAAGLTASERRACMADNPYEEGDTR